jgi:Sister chromatid cohesion protein Dcc1
MHLVSLSQPHDAASVLELSRSLEYEHEVRREVTLQVMRWFGEVDAADALWKMDAEKVVRQVGLSILRQHKVRVGAYHTSLTLTISHTRCRTTLYLRTSS